jgi:hypothetical protein
MTMGSTVGVPFPEGVEIFLFATAFMGNEAQATLLSNGARAR